MRKGNGLGIADKGPNGCRRVQVPTEAEVAALNAMREIKKKARSLKKRMQSLQDDSRERLKLQEEIDRLKAEWSDWEEKRKAEAKRRMILLGHEKE